MAAAEAMVQLYFSRKGHEVFMLKAAITEAGFWLGQPPAINLRPVDKASLAERLNDALCSPTARVPTPARDSFPTPTFLGFPYKKNWRSFHKDFDSISITFSGAGSYTTTAYKPDGLPDETEDHKYSGPNALIDVVDKVATRFDTVSHSY